MLSVAAAEKLIRDHLPMGPVERISTLESAGRILRVSVTAERAFPPFDRVMMDGIAMSRQAWEEGRRVFEVVGMAPAGAPRMSLEDPYRVIEVMTGAVLPKGTDLVIPVEQLRRKGDGVEVVAGFEPPEGGFVHRAGSDAETGAGMLASGRRLDARAMGVAVSCGAETVEVGCLPRLAIISTGDELVPLGNSIADHQIRRSNGPALAAAALSARVTEVTQRHLPDEEDAMRIGMTGILDRHDVVVLTGGVSMGTRDLVPATLEALGAETIFHRVAQRPGKPFLFAKRGKTLIFGLPGNPVSCLIGFRRYVQPALLAWQGAPWPTAPLVLLGEAVAWDKPMTYFLPVEMNPKTGEALPRPVANSGDFAALLQSDGFVELKAENGGVSSVGTRARFFDWS